MNMLVISRGDSSGRAAEM